MSDRHALMIAGCNEQIDALRPKLTEAKALVQAYSAGISRLEGKVILWSLWEMGIHAGDDVILNYSNDPDRRAKLLEIDACRGSAVFRLYSKRGKQLLKSDIHEGIRVLRFIKPAEKTQ